MAKKMDFSNKDFEYIYELSNEHGRSPDELKDIEELTDTEEECSLSYLSDVANKNQVINNLKKVVFKFDDFKNYSEKLQNTIMGSIQLLSKS